MPIRQQPQLFQEGRINNRKSKIISIRLSPEQYETFRSTYASSGRRSISALAREAMQRIICEGSTGAPISENLDQRFKDMSSRIDSMERDISQILALVATGRAGSKRGAGS